MNCCNWHVVAGLILALAAGSVLSGCVSTGGADALGVDAGKYDVKDDPRYAVACRRFEDGPPPWALDTPRRSGAFQGGPQWTQGMPREVTGSFGAEMLVSQSLALTLCQWSIEATHSEQVAQGPAREVGS